MRSANSIWGSFRQTLLLFSFVFLGLNAFAGPGDTTVVQVFTFGGPQDTTIVLPSVASTPTRKLMMAYTLKCNPAQNPACGEWDYLTYTYLYKKTGAMDSLGLPVVERFELARYITPYGINLSLGTGWTWMFDLTDYRTLLADTVRLTAGNWQELLDLRLLYIEGTPERPVLDVQNVWVGQPTYTTGIENFLSAKTMSTATGAQAARLKVRVTGHGADNPELCSEFCPKNHYWKLNGAALGQRLVWRDNCDVNPLKAQGGTWVYDRANWCPGAEVWTYDLDFPTSTNLAQPVTLDYDVEPHVWNGNGNPPYWSIETQLVSYGAPSFTTNAALVEVRRPTTADMWRHLNPACANPQIVVRNAGSTPLTEVRIGYSLNTVQTGLQTYPLPLVPPLQPWEERVLDIPANAQLDQASAPGTFIAWIENVNATGNPDQYAWDDTLRAPFVPTALMKPRFVVSLRTGLAPAESNLTITNDAGTVVWQKSGAGLATNTLYNDTVELGPACYTLRLADAGEDGLSWWANSNQGTGSFSLRKAETFGQYKAFSSDFGGEILYSFRTAWPLGNEQTLAPQSAPSFSLYPNPSRTGNITIEFTDVDFAGGQAQLDVLDMTGRVVQSQAVRSTNALSFSGLQSGMYLVRLTTPSGQAVKRLEVLK